MATWQLPPMSYKLLISWPPLNWRRRPRLRWILRRTWRPNRVTWRLTTETWPLTMDKVLNSFPINHQIECILSSLFHRCLGVRLRYLQCTCTEDNTVFHSAISRLSQWQFYHNNFIQHNLGSLSLEHFFVCRSSSLLCMYQWCIYTGDTTVMHSAIGVIFFHNFHTFMILW